MAMVKLETSGIEDMIRRLERAGGDARRITEEVLNKSARQITSDTYDALALQNLPRGGKYSTGRTRSSVIADPKTSWDGDTAWTPVGFDFAMPGAGGFLISGTPRMAPDQALRKMFRQKAYMRKLQNEMMEELWEELQRELGR